MQEDRVEHGTRGRVETKRDVRDAERRLNARVFGRNLANRLDGLDGVATRLFLSGSDGEREGVDNDVAHAHAPAVDKLIDESTRDAHLVFSRSGLALLVNGERNHGRSVLLNQWHDSAEARCRAVAVFIVDRVDHRATADEFEARLQHGRLG